MMTGEPLLPEVVRAFILKYVDSVAELEALLLAHSTVAQAWDVEQLARRLYIREREAEGVLHALHRRGLLAREDEGYRYGPVLDTLRADVDALAAAYPRFLIPISNLVHSKPAASLREFADAFKLREDR
jgi:hypothetical protein